MALSKTVTVDESYFKTLLRRAEFHTSDTGDDFSLIRIPKTVHDDLLRDSREYHTLRQALFNGGVAPEALEVLLQQEYPIQNNDDSGITDWSTNDQGWFTKPSTQPLRLGMHAATPWRGLATEAEGAATHGNGYNDPSWANNNRLQAGIWPPKRDTVAEAYSPYEDTTEDDGQAWSEQPQRKGPRTDNTLIFRNLPNEATHKDITGVVRGGRLVDVWLRKQERAAAVTFAEGATEFLAWTRRHDIIILGKRVDVAWSDRQYTITGQLASKLGNGHSRNLVIRGAAPRLTEAQIREDMEHIHNLVISACVTRGTDVYISTNSIDKATFARNCMLSRLPYKGLKIEWYPDECAEPIPKAVPQPVPAPQAKGTAPTTKTVPNRFNLLSLMEDDKSDSGGSDGSSHISGLPLARSIDASTVAA